MREFTLPRTPGWATVALWLLASVSACTYDFDKFAASTGVGARSTDGSAEAGSSQTDAARETGATADATGRDAAGGGDAGEGEGEAAAGGAGNADSGTPEAGGLNAGDGGGTTFTVDAEPPDGDTTLRDGGHDAPEARADAGASDGSDDCSAPVDGSAQDGGDSGAQDGSSFHCAAVSGVLYQGHCYYFRAAAASWDASSTACAPGHLATFSSAEELTAARAVQQVPDCWIGFRRTAPGMTTGFRWVTAESTTYTNWMSSEPNGSGDCVRVSTVGTWADLSCSQNLSALCEHD